MDRRLKEVNERQYTIVTPVLEKQSMRPILLVAVIMGAAFVVGFTIRGMALEGPVIVPTMSNPVLDTPTPTPTKTPSATPTRVSETLGSSPLMPTVTPRPTSTPEPKYDPCYIAKFGELCMPYGTATPTPIPSPTSMPTPYPFCKADDYKTDLTSADPCLNEKGLGPWN